MDNCAPHIAGVLIWEDSSHGFHRQSDGYCRRRCRTFSIPGSRCTPGKSIRRICRPPCSPFEKRPAQAPPTQPGRFPDRCPEGCARFTGVASNLAGNPTDIQALTIVPAGHFSQKIGHCLRHLTYLFKIWWHEVMTTPCIIAKHMVMY